MPRLCTQPLIQNSPSYHEKQYNLLSEKGYIEVRSSKVPGWVSLIKVTGTRRKLAQWDQIQAPLDTLGVIYWKQIQKQQQQKIQYAVQWFPKGPSRLCFLATNWCLFVPCRTPVWPIQLFCRLLKSSSKTRPGHCLACWWILSTCWALFPEERRNWGWLQANYWDLERKVTGRFP